MTYFHQKFNFLFFCWWTRQVAEYSIHCRPNNLFCCFLSPCGFHFIISVLYMMKWRLRALLIHFSSRRYVVVGGNLSLSFFPLHQLPPWEVKYWVVATFRVQKEIRMLLVLIFIAKKNRNKAPKKGVNGIIHVFGLPVTKMNIFTYKALLLVFWMM